MNSTKTSLSLNPSIQKKRAVWPVVLGLAVSGMWLVHMPLLASEMDEKIDSSGLQVPGLWILKKQHLPVRETPIGRKACGQQRCSRWEGLLLAGWRVAQVGVRVELAKLHS